MKLLPQHIGPLKIVAVKGNSNIHMQDLQTGKSYFAHSNRVKMGFHRQQIAHSTADQTKHDSKTSDVTEEANSQSQAAELPSPPCQIVSQLPAGDMLHKDLQNNLQSDHVTDKKGVDDSDVTNVQTQPKPVGGLPFKGAITRARQRKLAEADDKIANVLCAISKWQSLKDSPEC